MGESGRVRPAGLGTERAGRPLVEARMAATKWGLVRFEDAEPRYGPEHWERLPKVVKDSRRRAYRKGAAEGWAWDRGYEWAVTGGGPDNDPCEPARAAWDDFKRLCYVRDSTEVSFRAGWKVGIESWWLGR